MSRGLCVAVSCKEEGTQSCEEGAGNCRLPDVSAWYLAVVVGMSITRGIDYIVRLGLCRD